MEEDNKNTPQDVAPAPTPEPEKKTEESKPAPEPKPKETETPSKEELAAFRKWQESQKSDAEKQAAAISKAEKAQSAAEERAAAAELKLLALSKGATHESLEDVIALAKTKVNDKTTAEQAIAAILDKYPAFKGASASSGTTGIPTPNNPSDADVDEAKVRRVMELLTNSEKSLLFC